MPLNRDLPTPSHRAFHGGETVKITKTLKFEDDFVLEQGSQGMAMHPGSQAATWVVFFPKLKTRRVVPEWDLEVVSK